MDEFYILKSENVKEIKDILKWANNNSLNIYIDMLNCKKGFSRIVADKTFIEVLNLIDGETVDFFKNYFKKRYECFWYFIRQVRHKGYFGDSCSKCLYR